MTGRRLEGLSEFPDPSPTGINQIDCVTVLPMTIPGTLLVCGHNTPHQLIAARKLLDYNMNAMLHTAMIDLL